MKPIFTSLKTINQTRENLKNGSDSYTSQHCLLVLKQFSFYKCGLLFRKNYKRVCGQAPCIMSWTYVIHTAIHTSITKGTYVRTSYEGVEHNITNKLQCSSHSEQIEYSLLLWRQVSN